jgi:hypothetical protein
MNPTMNKNDLPGKAARFLPGVVHFGLAFDSATT